MMGKTYRPPGPFTFSLILTAMILIFVVVIRIFNLLSNKGCDVNIGFAVFDEL